MTGTLSNADPQTFIGIAVFDDGRTARANTPGLYG